MERFDIVNWALIFICLLVSILCPSTTTTTRTTIVCDNLQRIFANPPSKGIERRRRRRQWALILSRGTNPHNGNGFAQFTRLIVCDLPNSLQPPTTRPTTAEEKGNEFEFVYCLLSEEEVNNYNPIKLSAGTTATSRRSPEKKSTIVNSFCL